ncbi:GNAT family N-acetyltransferase [Streptomyces sp. NPDC093149]|uniref:GNAT family N-acetyltransferase n=1 Tax=Streptomyces sp. NPDC093149 TaxID=3366031 RepID=UPI0038237459
MYEIRPAQEDDLPHVQALVRARLRTLKLRGVARGMLTLADAERAASEHVVMTWDAQVVGAVTLIAHMPRRERTERDAAQPAFEVAFMVTDPAPGSEVLGWLLTRWAADLAARTGHVFIRARVPDSRLAEHFHTSLGWEHVRPVHTGTGSVYSLMQHPAVRSPALPVTEVGGFTPFPPECPARD